MEYRSWGRILYHIVVVTGASVMLSVGAFAFLCFIFNAKEISIAQGYLVSANIPLAVAPPITYLFGRFTHQLEEAHRELVFLSRMDELTGLLNRRTFMAEAQYILDQAQSTGTSVAFFLIDADHFKQVNDTYGHTAGDEALRLIAQIIQRDLRPDVIAGRLGGEEFAILVQDVHEEEAVKFAEQIRSAVQATPCVHDGVVFPISISIGVVVTAVEQPLKTLVRTADLSLYAAKTAGRNCCRLYRISNFIS